MEINGYENYLIYEDGRVWSKKRKIFMKPHICHGTGYYKLQLCKNSKKNCVSIHRLVALYYIPNPNNYPQIDHIDRDKTNNTISNLRWCDNSMNQLNIGLKKNNKLKQKYISIVKRTNIEYYIIRKKNYFCKYLNCKDYTLQDAINLRDSLLSIEDEIVEPLI